MDIHSENFDSRLTLALTYGNADGTPHVDVKAKVPDLTQSSYRYLNRNHDMSSVLSVCWLRPLGFSSTLLPRFFYVPFSARSLD